MLTAQVEDYLTITHELAPLYPAHWAELALNQDKVPLDVQWDLYDNMARAGSLFVVTLRDGPALVGYCICFATRSLHYGIGEVSTDIYRVLPSHRGRFGGVRLFREVIRHAKAIGAKRVHANTKLHKDASRLFAALGFAPTEAFHSLWVGGPDPTL